MPAPGEGSEDEAHTRAAARDGPALQLHSVVRGIQTRISGTPPSTSPPITPPVTVSALCEDPVAGKSESGTPVPGAVLSGAPGKVNGSACARGHAVLIKKPPRRPMPAVLMIFFMI